MLIEMSKKIIDKDKFNIPKTENVGENKKVVFIKKQKFTEFEMKNNIGNSQTKTLLSVFLKDFINLYYLKHFA